MGRKKSKSDCDSSAKKNEGSDKEIAYSLIEDDSESANSIEDIALKQSKETKEMDKSDNSNEEFVDSKAGADNIKTDIDTVPKNAEKLKGRSRPRKRSIKSNEEISVKKVNRGRGTPPKVRTLDDTQTSDSSAKDDTPKRNRGRPKKLGGIKKSPRKSIPTVRLENLEDDDSDEEYIPNKLPGRRRKSNSIQLKTEKKTGKHLTSQVDRLASLVDRLENRINLDGLVDESSDIETDLEVDVQVLLLQRNFNIKTDLRRDFKDIVKAYIEDLGTETGCLIASIRSYKNSGKFTVYEIWAAESEQLLFIKNSTSKLFEAETSEMLKTNTILKSMNIPASWWQRSN